MGPRRQSAESSYAARLVQLNRQWKISFLPPLGHNDLLHLQTWQLPYVEFFCQIQEIKNINFGTYPLSDHPDRLGAARKKLLVREIQTNVAQCSREKDNEAGWINSVANLVFRRLNGFGYTW
jgi:hypothetical protein